MSEGKQACMTTSCVGVLIETYVEGSAWNLLLLPIIQPHADMSWRGNNIITVLTTLLLSNNPQPKPSSGILAMSWCLLVIPSLSVVMGGKAVSIDDNCLCDSGSLVLWWQNLLVASQPSLPTDMPEMLATQPNSTLKGGKRYVSGIVVSRCPYPSCGEAGIFIGLMGSPVPSPSVVGREWPSALLEQTEKKAGHSHYGSDCGSPYSSGENDQW